MKIFIKILLVLFFSSICHSEDLYLDSSASGTNVGSSWTNAWESFGDVVFGTSSGEVGPGDTLYISGGSTTKTYSISASITPESGTAGNLTTIKISEESGHNGTAIIDGGDTLYPLISVHGKSYVIFDGRVTGDTRTITETDTGVELTQNTPHIKLQNWGGAGATNYSECVYSGANSTAIEFYGLFLYNDDTTCTESDCSDIELKRGMRFVRPIGVTISDCELDGCVRESLYVYSDEDTWDLNIIEKNLITSYINESGQGGADGIKDCGSTTIRYNRIHYEELVNAEFNSSHDGEDGIQISPDQNNVKVYGNVVDGAASCLRIDPESVGPVDNVWVWSNVFYLNHTTYTSSRGVEFDGSGATAYTPTDIKIYNNTLVDFASLYAIDIYLGATVDAAIYVKNNILVNGSLVVTSGDTSHLDIDYNLVLASNLSTKGTITGITQSNDPYDSGKIMAFESYSPNSDSNNFELLSTATMAIDSGENLGSVYETDLNGIARGTLWDVGAYEYVAPIVGAAISGGGISGGGISGGGLQ